MGLKEGVTVAIPDAEGEVALASVPIKVEFTGQGTHSLTQKCQHEHTDESLSNKAFSQNAPPIKQCRTLKNVYPHSHLAPLILQAPAAAPPPTVGCRWSMSDWSCSYNSVFMVFCYMYAQADENWQMTWAQVNPLCGTLAASFEFILQSDTNCFSPEGARIASIVTILRLLCGDDEPLLQMVPMSPSGFPPAVALLNFGLPQYCVAVRNSDTSNAHMSLQLWLDLWLQRQLVRLNCGHCASEREETFIVPSHDIGLHDAPPVIFFEVMPHKVGVIVPSDTLTL
ncbi:uncharacterized protein F5891DRAFT_1199776 [Suillus fuscotomentosus]|uniref:Uncharacterized protein n=1 Tax=Suillus fuscotomentosus TaxID=1912939 RepID=A0AAD4DP46_9AGAM|nr:uncharacterized protein F5891DRAFT_1199776 [Suillus fuscotomentosus]KAG1887497.1 hypothetical protein F5891DRAFT_1199776 [Suillus fuscotomentosus]